MAVYYNNIETGNMYLGSTELAKKYLGNTEVAPGVTPWSPALMSGLVAWYRADEGVTYDSNNNVTSWAPITGSQVVGNAASTLTVKSGGTSPKYLSSVSGMNNKPGIEFGTVSTTENLRTSATNSAFNTGNASFNWFVTTQTSNANGGAQFIGGAAGEFNGGGGFFGYVGTNYTSNNNAFVIQAPEQNGPAAYANLQPISSYPKSLSGLYVQGASLSSFSEGAYFLNNIGSPANLWNTTQGIFKITPRLFIYILGNDNSLTTPFYGTILETGVNLTYNASDWAQLQEYVQERYNITF